MQSRKCELCSQVFSTPGNKRRHEKLFHGMDYDSQFAVDSQQRSLNLPHLPLEAAEEVEEDEDTPDEDVEDTDDTDDEDEAHEKMQNDADVDEAIWYAMEKTLPKVPRDQLLMRAVCYEWLEKLRRWIFTRVHFVEEFQNTELYENLEKTKEGYENMLHLEEEEAWKAAWAARRPSLMKLLKKFVETKVESGSESENEEENVDASDDIVMGN
jgi:hypothetical protein